MYRPCARSWERVGFRGRIMATNRPESRKHRAWQQAIAPAIVAALLLSTPARGQSTAIYSQPQSAAPVASQAAYQQTPVEEGAKYRAFPLNKLDPATAERQLAQFFAAVPGVEVVADAPRSRLLVRADDNLLRQAGEFLSKIDPPVAAAPSIAAPPPANAPQPPAQQLETYPLTPASQTILAALEKQAAGRPDIRIAVDQRSSQVLVLAPNSIHSQIREKIAQAAAPLTPPPAPGVVQVQALARPEMQSFAAPPPSAAQPSQPVPTNGPLRLQNLRADDLRVRLERLLARPLPASTDTSGQWQTFEIEAVPGAAVIVTVNPTTGELHLSGPPHRTSAWRQVFAALDSAPQDAGSVTQLVATKPANHQRVRQVLQAIQTQHTSDGGAAPGRLAAMLQEAQGAAEPAAPTTAIPSPAAQAQTAVDAANIAQAAGELLGPVQIEFVEGLDVIVLRGADRDVERVMKIIEQIEQLSAVTTPTVEIYPLKNVNSEALAALLNRLYQQVLTARLGEVIITPLVKPNALLLVGRPENVRMAVELIQKLDVQVAPATRYEVFPLKNASAADAKTMIDQFLDQEEQEEEQQQAAATEVPTLATKALVVADVRTNSLIVSAAPRDLIEIATLVAKIDSTSGAAVDQVRVFSLRNAVATEMADVLRSASTLR